MADRERVRRKKSKDILVIPPRGESAEEQFDQDLAIAVVVGISLINEFKNGRFTSTKDLKRILDDIRIRSKINEIDLTKVSSYLLGVLHQADYDSPLRQSLKDEGIDWLHDDEIVTRHAVTTIRAFVEDYQTTKPSGK